MSQWPNPGMEWLHEMGFATAAMALRDDSVSIDDPELMAEAKLAPEFFVMGEFEYVKSWAGNRTMSHGVDSLNVAAASAVAFWQLGNRS